MSLFGTAGVRGSAVEEVPPELALAVGRAAAREAGGDEFALGRDGRETSPALADAIASGLASGGADVVRVGAAPTPALAFASRGRRGVQVTASHNPPADNGIKCFADGVEYDREAEAALEEGIVATAADVEDVVERGGSGADDSGATDAEDPDAMDADDRLATGVAAEAAPVAWDRWGDTIETDVLPEYREAVAEYVRDRAPDGVDALAGRRVAVDCGTGVAGLATPHVLRRLGAVPVALDANVDGHFPARESKPTPESLSSLRRFLARREDVLLGLGHDGDGDRVVAVGPDGDVVHEDTVVAVLAEHYVAASDADDPVVVTTPNASGRIDERVAAAGGRTERVALGQLHEGVARERAAGDAGTEVAFAAEPWKHIHTHFGGWMDAITSAALLAALAAEAGSLAQLTSDVSERPYRKVNVRCEEPDKEPAMGLLRERLPAELEHEDLDTEYGVRLDLDAGWVLVRPSGTEPYLRLYAEHDDVDEVVASVRELVEQAVEES